MTVVLHWFLPTNGDSRSDLSLGNAVGVRGSRAQEGGPSREPDIAYIGQVARSAEQLGFQAALTPTSSASTSSSCPAIRTSRRPTASVRACCPFCAGVGCSRRARTAL